MTLFELMKTMKKDVWIVSSFLLKNTRKSHENTKIDVVYPKIANFTLKWLNSRFQHKNDKFHVNVRVIVNAKGLSLLIT